METYLQECGKLIEHTHKLKETFRKFKMSCLEGAVVKDDSLLDSEFQEIPGAYSSFSRAQASFEDYIQHYREWQVGIVHVTDIKSGREALKWLERQVLDKRCLGGALMTKVRSRGYHDESFFEDPQHPGTVVYCSSWGGAGCKPISSFFDSDEDPRRAGMILEKVTLVTEPYKFQNPPRFEGPSFTKERVDVDLWKWVTGTWYKITDRRAAQFVDVKLDSSLCGYKNRPGSRPSAKEYYVFDDCDGVNAEVYRKVRDSAHALPPSRSLRRQIRDIINQYQ